jgi:DNA mismatch repair protein MutL
MGKIKKLAPDEIQKIAAGEVVERPSNIVKELIENSLDAGATAISVYVQHGGKSLIRIVDNGCGIALDDVDLALTHHATSKLTTVDELNTIETFGFRGEALSSISSVSKMTLITREAPVVDAVQLKIDAGRIVERSNIARDVGTDIAVEDLFFNVPARRKFLKSDETEWNAIYKVVHALALAHVTCGFKLYHNDRLVFQCQSSDTLINRAKILFETDALSECVAHSGDEFSITGFISQVRVTRYDRSSIFVFANRRWIKNSKLTHAVIKGYAGVLPPARYPCGALFIDIEQSMVDVNIHPRKEEVSFLHPRRVELAIESMIKKTLENTISQAFAPKQTVSLFTPTAVPFANNYKTTSVSYQPYSAPTIEPRESFAADKQQQNIVAEHAVQQSCLVASPTEMQTVASMSSAEYRLIGQLQLTYIMIETDDSMILIDQHAAHERILYELFAQRFHEVAVVSLMFPLVINFSQRECDLLEKNKAVFSSYGLCFEQCGQGQYALTALPVVLHEKNVPDMVHEFLASCETVVDADQVAFKDKLHHSLRAQMACKAAVKAGDALPKEQMQSLIEQLNGIENRFSCPHGRPTIWRIGFAEIERKFKRRV